MVYRTPTWDDLKKNRSSAMAIAAVLVAMILFYALWLAPVSSEKSELQTRTTQLLQLEKKYREKLNQAEGIRTNLASHEAELKTMQQLLFQGNDPYQLAAALGELLKGGHKLDIKTYQVLTSKEYGLYQEVHLRFNLMTTIEGLQYLLDKLKDSHTAVQIQEINIQKIQRQSGPDLVINVILAALMGKGEKT
jgi:DNA repair exonuclease SbcCD ATPase subunit